MVFGDIEAFRDIGNCCEAGPMHYIYLLGTALTWLLLLPGNLACNALAVGKANNCELVRMLVNSLAWTMVGVVVVSIVV